MHNRLRRLTGRTLSDHRQALAVRREGSVLLIVLVVLLLLSLAAYTFSDVMLVEYEASVLAAREAKTRAFADSGIEIAATILSNRIDMTENLFHDPTRFQLLMEDSTSDRGRGRVSIVSPILGSSGAAPLRFGLASESAKLSLQFAAENEYGRDMLMMLPGMTDELADTLLDWVDEDSEPRDFGAEIDDYLALGIIPADGAEMHSLDELLVIPGVTAALLYGEDANRNGLLDANENDGENPPFDNADGVLDPGWSAYLTVNSRQSNLAMDGSERIYINNSTPTELYEELVEVLDEDQAEFIVAYALFGPSNFDVMSDTEQSALDSGLSASEQAQMAEAANQVAQNLFGASGDGSVTIGPNELDASGGKQFTINSFFELIDAEVEAVGQNNTTVTLTSPWRSDSGSMDTYLPEMLDLLTTTEETVIRGRIDVNQAPFEVLMTIPDMDEATAGSIVSAQLTGGAGGQLSDPPVSRATHGWLWSEGIMDRETFLQFEKYFTAGGDVYTAQVVGHFDRGGPQTRMQVMLDAGEYPARILFARDLSYLGPAYSPQMLQVQSAAP
jgi:hypothetical protein